MLIDARAKNNGAEEARIAYKSERVENPSCHSEEGTNEL